MRREFCEWLSSCNVEFLVGGLRYESAHFLCIGFMEGNAYVHDDEWGEVMSLVHDLGGGDIEALDAMDELMALGKKEYVCVAKSDSPSVALSEVEDYFRNAWNLL